MPRGYADLDKKQSGDPNIMRLKEANKIRPLDNMVAGWRQHGIEHPSDPEQFASVVCPGPRSCPLDRKPVDATGKPRFPISRRFAANVWDYETNSVKVLVSGPSVFDEFKKVAQVGIDPGSSDWTILKSGQGIKTEYQVVRHDPAPFAAAQITPDMLHDVTKYEQPLSTEAIFEVLERFGIDWDSLETPTYSFDEALAFVMPYGKHKGFTVEQLLAQEADYAHYIHSSKLEQGSLGDPVFLALQTAMVESGLVPPLDDALAQLPSPEPPPLAGAAAAPVSGAASNLDAPVETRPIPGGVTLRSPIGVVGDFPPEAVDGLLGVGFTRVEPEPVSVDSNAPVKVLIGGNEVELPREQAELLLAAGTAQPVAGAQAPAEPEFHLPLPDEEVEVSVGGVEVKMPFVQAQALASAGSASFVDDRITERLAQLAVDPTGSAASPTSGATPSVVPDPDKPFYCEQCGSNYKTQGALTQHKNREHKAAEPQPSAVPAASNGGGLVDEVKELINHVPYARDFTRILNLMEEATGSRDFASLDEAQLARFKDRLLAEGAK